ALAEARRILLRGRAEVVIAGTCDAIPPEIRALWPEAPVDGARLYVLERAGRRAGHGAVLGGGAAFGPDAARRAVAAAIREAPPGRVPDPSWLTDLRSAVGQGTCRAVVAQDPLGAAAALIVE